MPRTQARRKLLLRRPLSQQPAPPSDNVGPLKQFDRSPTADWAFWLSSVKEMLDAPPGGARRLVEDRVTDGMSELVLADMTRFGSVRVGRVLLLCFGGLLFCGLRARLERVERALFRADPR